MRGNGAEINVTLMHSRSIFWTAMRRLLPLLVLALASACGANADSPSAKTNAGDASASPMDAGAGADASAVPTSCDDPPDARPAGATCVLEAKGTVEDLSGAPLDKLVMTFCGGQCYGTQSDPSGAFAIPIGTYLPTEDYAMHADGRPDHAVDYLRFTANEPSVISATMRLPTLPPSTVQLPPDGSPASSVTVGDLDPPHPGQHDLRSRHRGLRDGDRTDSSGSLRAAGERAERMRPPRTSMPSTRSRPRARSPVRMSMAGRRTWSRWGSR